MELQKLKKFITSRSALQKIVKESFRLKEIIPNGNTTVHRLKSSGNGNMSDDIGFLNYLNVLKR